MIDIVIAYLLAIFVLVAGVSWMFGGKSWAAKVVQWPPRFVWKQAEKLLNWGFRQLKNAVKAAFRGLWRLVSRPFRRSSRRRGRP